jgi:hypothetical protein
MKRVFKYPIAKGPNIIEIYAGARPRWVHYQDSRFGQGASIWVEIDDEHETKENYGIYVVATGVGVPKDGGYVGSFETGLGEIYHVYWKVGKFDE